MQADVLDSLRDFLDRGLFMVGVSGKKRAGKDTFFFCFKNTLSSYRFPVIVKRYAFADHLKSLCHKHFNISQITDKEQVRRIYQAVGQLIREEVDENYWRDIVLSQILQDYLLYAGREPARGLVAVVTDVRYKNEAEVFRNPGCFLVRIERGEIGDDDPHPSEVDLDDYDFPTILHNRFGLSEFEHDIRLMAEVQIIPKLNKAFPHTKSKAGEPV